MYARNEWTQQRMMMQLGTLSKPRMRATTQFYYSRFGWDVVE